MEAFEGLEGLKSWCSFELIFMDNQKLELPNCMAPKDAGTTPHVVLTKVLISQPGRVG